MANTNLSFWTIGLMGLCLIPNPVFAKTWAVDYAHSKLSFTGKQGAETFQGGFKTFAASIDLDPAHPETGKITASIDMTSATAGGGERDAYLPQSDWFDTGKFPNAEFVSSKIYLDPKVPAKTCQYPLIAEGTLSIKGIGLPVKLPICLNQEGDHMHGYGTVPLIRTDYKIGTGQWSGEDMVGHTVAVTVDITAK